MIPRYQRILLWTLVCGCTLLALFLIRGCHQAHKRLTALNDATPIAAPVSATNELVALYVANDADATITPTEARVPLPQDPPLRARALLNYLLAQYSQENSAHPLKSGPAVDDVFLLAKPKKAGSEKSDAGDAEGGKVAVVNLNGAFASNHPSGIECETLTVMSMIGTLHAAMPEVTEIRFLVEGEQRETLAGHSDLTRAYKAVDTSHTR
jgi:hypothetical protein